MNSHNEHNSTVTPAALLEQLVYVDTFMPEIDDPSQLDEKLTAELSAFADDSFIFPDEDKPQRPEDDVNDNHNNHNNLDNHTHNNIINNDGPNNLTLQNPAQSLLFNQLNNHGLGSASDQSLLNSFGNAGGLSNVQMSLSMNPLTNNQVNPQSNVNTATPTNLLSALPKVPVPPGAQSSLIAAGLSQTQIDALAALIAQHQGSKPETSGSSPSPQLSALQQLQTQQQVQLLQQRQQAQTQQAQTTFMSPLSSTLTGSSSSSLNLTHSRNNNTTTQHTEQHAGDDDDDYLGMELPDVKLEPTGDSEFDKRRRNTAASARFRIKKKLKEKQLERSVRELSELTMTLEKKIQTLEMENRLLRNLVVEKGEQRNNNELEMLKQRARMASTSVSTTSASNPGSADQFGNNGSTSSSSTYDQQK